MKRLLKKEMKLSASLLSYLFISLAFLTLVPGYPILLGSFFVTLGLFYSFQSARENNDVSYSLLLPVAKKDLVKSKFLFCIVIETCGFTLMTLLTIIRMTLLKDAAVYRTNALMNANLVFLAFALLVFGCFHLIFLRGYFKTAYYFGKPFVKYIIAVVLIIGAAESLRHVPGLEKLNSFGFEEIGLQCAVLITGAVLYVLMTAAAMGNSIKSFERIDL